MYFEIKEIINNAYISRDIFKQWSVMLLPLVRKYEGIRLII